MPRRRATLSPEFRSLQKSYAANTSWLGLDAAGRAERTRKARETFNAKLLEQAGGDKREAARLRKMHMQRMLLRSIAARKAQREAEQK